MAGHKSKPSRSKKRNNDLRKMADAKFEPWTDSSPEEMWDRANRTHMVWLRMALAGMFLTRQQLIDGFGDMDAKALDEMFNGFREAKEFLKAATETIGSAEARIMCALAGAVAAEGTHH